MNPLNSRDRIRKMGESETNGPKSVLYGLISKLVADKDKAFYGNLLQMFNYSFVQDGKKRPDFDIGLEIEKDKIRFVINPYVFFNKDETEQASRLIHELEHVLRNDVLFEPEKSSGYTSMVASYHEYIDENGKKQSYKKITPLASLAMDLAINSLKFKDNPKDYSENTDFLLREGIFPTLHPFETYPPYQTWEWYYEQMVDDAKNGRNGFSEVEIGVVGNSELDNNPSQGNSINNSWNLTDGNGKELSKADVENIKNFISLSVEQAISKTEKSAGTVPGRYQSFIDDLKKIPYNWRSKIDRFVFSGVCPDQRSSKRKISRRARSLGCIAPGVIGKPDVSIWIFIDVSGSIDRKAFENIINHANKLRESTKASVWITNFDATIQDTFVLDQYNYKEILKTKLSHTQGGTMFAPIFDKLRSEKKFKPDVTLIFTDGYCFDNYDMPKNLRMMWVMTEDHKKQPNGPHLIMKEYF